MLHLLLHIYTEMKSNISFYKLVILKIQIKYIFIEECFCQLVHASLLFHIFSYMFWEIVPI